MKEANPNENLCKEIKRVELKSLISEASQVIARAVFSLPRYMRRSFFTLYMLYSIQRAGFLQN